MDRMLGLDSGGEQIPFLIKAGPHGPIFCLKSAIANCQCFGEKNCNGNAACECGTCDELATFR